MNPIGYREFKKDLLEIFTERELAVAVHYTLIEEAEDWGEKNRLLHDLSVEMGKMRMLVQIMRSLEHYEEVGHLFPPFS